MIFAVRSVGKCKHCLIIDALIPLNIIAILLEIASWSMSSENDCFFIELFE